jgi:hypothetical protein
MGGRGDPAFKALAYDDFAEREYETKPSVLDVFTPEEVVHMVNRYIAMVQYQHTAHNQRAKRHREALKEVKKMVHRMFHVSYDNATEEQIRQAMKEVARQGR